MAATAPEGGGPAPWLSRKKESCFLAFEDFHGAHILSVAPIITAVSGNWLSKYLRIEQLALTSPNRLVPALLPGRVPRTHHAYFSVCALQSVCCPVLLPFQFL